MPEGPEVQIQVDGLQKIIGKGILNVLTYDGVESVIDCSISRFVNTLEGALINSISRKGKYIIWELQNPVVESKSAQAWIYMVVHLGMTGGFLIDRSHHNRKIDFWLNDDMAVTFYDIRKFGNIKLLTADELVAYFKRVKIGLDILGSSFNEISDRLIGIIYGRKYAKKTIKELLLDQSILSGLGNIYANEALFHARIHPSSFPKDITWDDCRRLALACHNVIVDAYLKGGSSISDYVNVQGVKGTYQDHHAVYGRSQCDCGALIEKIEIAGRSTYYCLGCQRRRSVE